MIVYKLKCSNSHEFEGWFKDIASFEEQFGAKHVICPVCGNPDLTKVIACNPSIGSARKKEERISSEGESLRYALLKKVSDHVKREFENVGPRFREEAKKIFFREVPPRNIYGTTTEKEEKELKDDGIEFFKFPMLKDTDD